MQKTIKLLVQEHPIMDVVAKVSQSFLKKYDLPVNATVDFTPRLTPIYEEITKKFKCDYRPAGSAFNTLRACQVSSFERD
jgi:hypothetical protein